MYSLTQPPASVGRPGFELLRYTTITIHSLSLWPAFLLRPNSTLRPPLQPSLMRASAACLNCLLVKSNNRNTAQDFAASHLHATYYVHCYLYIVYCMHHRTKGHSLYELYTIKKIEFKVVKFIYSEKATKFLRNLHLFWLVLVHKVEISQNFCGLLRIYEL